MHTSTRHSSNRRRWAQAIGGGVTALVALAAVASPAGAATTTPTRPIGASGSVAALTGSSMEVQNASSGQTTVSWTTTTQFSKTVTEGVSSLTAGSCVTVTGTASKNSKTTIAARSITVTTANSSGTCGGLGTRINAGSAQSAGGTGAAGGFQFRRGGGGFGSGGGEGGTSGSRPSFPSGGSGAGNFRKELANLAIASGKVTEVKGSTITVTGIDLSPGSFPRRTTKSSSKNSKPAKRVVPKTEKLTITTSGSTTLSATQTAAATDLAVGDCVSAFGPAATNGAVTATTVRITSTGGQSCTGGFGGFGGGGAFFGGGPGGPGGPGGAGGAGGSTGGGGA